MANGTDQSDLQAAIATGAYTTTPDYIKDSYDNIKDYATTSDRWTDSTATQLSQRDMPSSEGLLEMSSIICTLRLYIIAPQPNRVYWTCSITRLVIEQVLAKCSAFCFFSGCCSETEVSEQLYSLRALASNAEAPGAFCPPSPTHRPCAPGPPHGLGVRPPSVPALRPRPHRGPPMARGHSHQL
jgi:hypothetical protein